MKKYVFLTLALFSFLFTSAAKFDPLADRPIRIKITFDDGCFLLLEGEYSNGHFQGTLTSGGTSPHCPTGTWTINFRSQNPQNGGIEIVCSCDDLCKATQIEFTTSDQDLNTVVNYLNSISLTILQKFKENACN
jgi:hypothetical protein